MPARKTLPFLCTRTAGWHNRMWSPHNALISFQDTAYLINDIHLRFHSDRSMRGMRCHVIWTTLYDLWRITPSLLRLRVHKIDRRDSTRRNCKLMTIQAPITKRKTLLASLKYCVCSVITTFHGAVIEKRIVVVTNKTKNQLTVKGAYFFIS